MTKNIYLIFNKQITVSMITTVDSWYLGGEDINISIIIKFK